MNDVWSFDQMRPIDIVCMGRVAIDLYAEQIGCPLEDVETFKKYLGGCAGNIAVGTARLGLHSAMLSCVGTDAMGQFLINELQKEGVNTSLLKETKHHLTGLVILGIEPPDKFPLIFYRENCADMQLNKDHIHPDFFAKSKSLLITGTGLSTESMRETSHHAVTIARSVDTKVIFDLDYRPVLWGLTVRGDGESRYKMSEKVSQHYQAIIPKCHLIVGTEDEVLIAGNANSLDTALLTIRSLTSAPIILKRGEKGCEIYFENKVDSIKSRPFPVKVLNVLGAGDAFISGFMRGLLRNEPWETCATYANACGAIVVTRHGCAPAMPSFNEMQEFIEQYGVTTKGKNHVGISHT